MPASRFAKVRHADRDSWIASEVQIADTSLQRMVGLLRHRSLHENQGLWIKPSSGVHTFGMRFAIDVVGLDRKHRVVRLWKILKPHRLTTIVPAVRSVLELPAGSIEQCGIRIGDQLRIEEICSGIPSASQIS